MSIYKYIKGACAPRILLGFLLSALPVTVLAQTSPPLGQSAAFAVLGGSAVTNTGPSIVSGELGVSPGTAVTGFPPGLVINGSIHSADAVALQAQSDLVIAYNVLAGQALTATLTGSDLGGLTLGPGVYRFASSAQLTGTLTLDARGDPAAVFIFQIGSTLTTASAANVLLINGGRDCNVYWQIGSSATLGTGTTLAGSILALTSITLNTNASVSGRLLARNGAVTLDSATVTVCAAGCAPITLAPTSLPDATVGQAYTAALVASGGVAPYTYSLGGGALPAGLGLSAGGVIAGSPTTSGVSLFTIDAVDSLGCEVSRNYAIVVAPVGCAVITFTPASLPSALIGVPFTQAFVASGGIPPYSFSVAAGAAPPGLLLSGPGLLSGTPTVLGNFSFTVTATDATSCPASRPYVMPVTNGGGGAPGGPGEPPIALPTLSTWTLMLLALLMVATVGWQRRAALIRTPRK